MRDRRLKDTLTRLGENFAVLAALMAVFSTLYPSIPNFLKTFLHIAAASTATFLLFPMTLLGVFVIWAVLFTVSEDKAKFSILATFGLGTLVLVSGLWGGMFLGQTSGAVQIHLAAFQFDYRNAYAIGFVTVMAMGIGTYLVRSGSSVGLVLWTLIQPAVNKWVESLVARMRSLLHISA